MSEKYIQRTQTVILPNGTTKRLKGKGKTEKEALMKLAKKVADFEAGKIFTTSKTTFEVYAEKYLQLHKAPQVTADTLENDRRRLRLYFYPTMGKTPLERATSNIIQYCLNEMQAAGLSQDYIKKAYYLVFNIFDRARIDRLVQYNNVESCTIPQGKPPQKRRALTEEEREYFLAACEIALQKSSKAIVYLLSYDCGLRPAEARAIINRGDINLKDGTITISRRVDKRGKIKPPKSAAGYRVIPIPDRLLEKLRKMPVNINTDGFMFGGEKPMTKQNYERGWNNIKRLMDIQAGAVLYRNQIVKSVIDSKITPYYLRHTYCTRLAEEGVDIRTAQYWMGHSSIKMTADIYTHVTQKMAAAATPAVRAM